MRDFEDMSGAKSEGMQHVHCPGSGIAADRSDSDVACGSEKSEDRCASSLKHGNALVADFDVRQRPRRADRPWASRLSSFPRWRAAGYGRGLAS